MTRLGLGVCLFLAGCISPNSIERNERFIVNGSPTTGDDPVVALLYQGFDFCTGTLIAPSVVLTAAHCVDPQLGGAPTPTDIDVFFGNDVSLGGTFVDVKGGAMHPDWDLSQLSNDIALLALDAPVATLPKPMHRESFVTGDIGVAVRLIGFGVTAASAFDSGIKRETVSVLTEFDATTFTNSDAPGQTCFGDSGGPLFVTPNSGVESVAGVTSWGDDQCTVFGVNTRVDAYIDSFIAPFVRTHTTFADTGALCERAADCGSRLCLGSIGDPDERHCAEVCIAGADPCPVGPDTVQTVCTATTTPDFFVCAHPGPVVTCADFDDCHPGMCAVVVASRPRGRWPAASMLLLLAAFAIKRRQVSWPYGRTRRLGA